jgi:hypothetical protein
VNPIPEGVRLSHTVAWEPKLGSRQIVDPVTGRSVVMAQSEDTTFSLPGPTSFGWWVYRAYRAWELAYVGSCRNPRARMRSHRRLDAWWGDVDLVFLHLVSVEETAFEEWLIRELHPIRNMGWPKRDAVEF